MGKTPRSVSIAVLQTDIKYIREKLDELSRKFDGNTKEVVELTVRVDELEKRIGEVQSRMVDEHRREMIKWSTIVTAAASILATIMSALMGRIL